MNKSVQDWSKSHVEDFHLQSDIFYSRLCNRLRKVISGVASRFPLLADKRAIDEIAFKCASYLEDIVSGFGIFQTFRNIYFARHDSAFGSADSEYLDDEVNHSDICFLINLCLPELKGPEAEERAEEIHRLADVLFPVMCKAWESAPECIGMASLLRRLLAADEYERVVSIMVWLFTRCYLTKVEGTLEELEQTAREFCRDTAIDYKQLRYTLLCNGACEVFLPVMRLMPSEFEAAMARTYGLEETASHLDESVYIPTSVFEITGVDDLMIHARCIKTEDNAPGAEGIVFDISLKSFYLSNPVEKGMYFTGALMRYAGQWNLNGLAVFNTENPLGNM